MTRRGLTLMELLLVIALLAILFALIFPVVARVKVQARRSACTFNLKQMHAGIRMYQSDYNETLPCVLALDTDIYAKRRVFCGLFPRYVASEGVFVCPNDEKRGVGVQVERELIPPLIPVSYYYLFSLNCRPRYTPSSLRMQEAGRYQWTLYQKWLRYPPGEIGVVQCFHEDALYATGDMNRQSANWTLFLDGHVDWATTLPHQTQLGRAEK